MLQTVEAELDVNGQIRWLEPLRVTETSRVLVTLLQKINGAAPPQGNAAKALEFLRANRLPAEARPSVEEMEAQITEARESWD